MRGYGAFSAPERRDGQCGGIARRIVNGDGCVDFGGLHQGHFDDLAGAGSSSYDGVGELVAVESQIELPGFVHTDLKQDLIGADGPEIELRCVNACDGGACVGGPILRERDIRADRDGGCVVARH